MADAATLVYDIDSAAARTAASDLAKLNAASAKAAGGADKLNKSLRDTQGRFRSSYDVAKQYGGEIQSLAAKYNPALSAVYQYQQAQLEVNRAVALGVLTQGQADAALERTAAQLRSTAAASQQFGAAQKQTGAYTANVFAQLNDIGVMMAAGQNPFQLALQQGTQLNQVWASMGKDGKTLSGVYGMLRGAVVSMISPMNLLTMGVIAGGAALVGWGMSALNAEDDAKSLEDILSDLSDNIAEINRLNKLASTSGSEAMAEAYGQVTQEVRELIAAQRYLATEMAKDNLGKAMESLANQTGTTFWQSWFGSTAGGVTVPQAIIDAENRIENLRSLMNLTQSDARSLGAAFDSAFNAKTIQDQVNALQTLREYLTILAQSGREGADAAREMLKEVSEAEDEARKLLAAAGQLPAAFASAAAAAAKITDELNRAVNAAVRLANSAISDSRFAQIELDFRTDDIGKAGALAAAKFDEEVGKAGMDQWLYNSLRQQAIDGAKETARILGEVDRLNEADREAEKGSKGGGGAAKAAAKQYQTLRELLQEDTLFQVAEYEKRSAQLAEARARDLLSEEQYQIMKQQLQMLYFGMDYERNAVNYALSLDQLKSAREAELLTEQQFLMQRQQLQHDYYSEAINTNQNQSAQTLSNMAASFGQMNQLAGGGYDKLLKAQRAFAAGSALINAYLAATQAAADPTVPFWMKLAAYAKVLAAGMGAVNAIKGGSESGGGGGTASSAVATKAQPTQYVTIDVTGDSWAVGLVEGVIEQIQQQTKDGRVVFMGNGR